MTVRSTGKKSKLSSKRASVFSSKPAIAVFVVIFAAIAVYLLRTTFAATDLAGLDTVSQGDYGDFTASTDGALEGNLGGYAAKAPVTDGYSAVLGQVVLPHPKCPNSNGELTYWSGLASNYAASSSTTLEQTGVGIFCPVAGQGARFAYFYELVPAGPKWFTDKPIHGGDTIRFGVNYVGNNSVRLITVDTTTGQTLLDTTKTCGINGCGRTYAFWTMERPGNSANVLGWTSIPFFNSLAAKNDGVLHPLGYYPNRYRFQISGLSSTTGLSNNGIQFYETR